METYKVPSHINNNKLYLVKRSELEDRFDPLYYSSDLTKFNIGKYRSDTINSIAINLKTGVGAGKKYQTNDESGIIQIRPTNIDENGFLKYDKNIYIPFNASLDSVEFNDVLFNNTNSQELVGKTAILKESSELFYSNHITKISVDPSKILADYLWIILNIYQKNKIFYSICTNWNNQSGVGLKLLKSLKIPLPPLEIQQQIVDFYQNAYQQKQQKETEAQAILESIDTYLLTELGIALPEKDNSLQNRIFTTMLSEISGGRLDPKLYDTNTTRLKRSLYNTDENRFIKSPLKKLIVQSISGDWGSEKVDDFDKQKYKKCLVIRATEFDNDYNLNLINPKIKFRLIKNEKLKKIDIQENDLLIEKSGGSLDQPVGRIAILDNKIINENIICYSNFIHKIRINEKLINPKYLFSYLKTIYNIKLTESMQSQTNGIRNLIMSNYFNQTILIPKNQDNSVNFEKQNEIAEHIQQLRSRAKHLQEEAKNILEQAKQEVEKMILGE